MLHRYNFVCFVYFISYNSLVNIYNVILFVKYVNKKSIYKLSIYTFRIFFITYTKQINQQMYQQARVNI